MNDAYSEMLKVRCLGDISPKVWASYTYSKNAVRMINTAKDLGNKIPHDIAIDLAPGRYVERPSGSMVGREYELNKLQELAADEEVIIIGIYGMGGVGKTALLDKFHNETPLKGTHLIIRVNMNGLHNVEDTQQAILEKLALVDFERENEEARACRITEYLNKKSFILILDNVWKAVDLKVVGVPIGTRQTKSKVIVATRIESVCDGMNAKKTKIQVKCLNEEDAWILFTEKAGKELIDSNPIIRHHAEILVNKCGGLPLALINIGHAVAGKKTPELWQHAITALENTPQEAPGMKDVLNCLKLSYDNLADDRLKICLLYCTLFPEGYDMCSDWIVDYCIGEGVLVDQFYAGNDVYNEGYSLLDTLKSASMLEPGRDPGEIKMHPMMRVSVIWIESGTEVGKCLIRAGKELAEAPEVDEWRGVERVSLVHNNVRKLSEKPYSPCLLTLFLNFNPLVEICDGFFWSMKNLRVLDLSHTLIQEVPAEIGELVQLQYLDFCDTCIASLPPEVGNLVRLRYFLLSDTENLVSIPQGLIAKLTELRVLYMESSFEEWKVDSAGKGPNMEELQFLKRLKALGISINTLPALKKLAGSNRLAQCTRRLEIRDCPGLNSTLSTANLASNFKALEMLFLGECSDLEEFLIDDRGEWSSTLPHLTNLWLGELPRAKISWNSGCLQKLKYLIIEDCSNIRQLIHCINESIEGKEEGEEGGGEEEEDEDEMEDDEEGGEDEDGAEEDEHEGRLREINVLPNLYSLELKNLPELESLSCGSRPLAFPSLEILDVDECPKLKKLPLNAERLQCISGQLSWWNGLAWPKKHDDIKSKFKSIFKAEYPSTGMPRVTSQRLGEKVVASGLAAADKDPPFEQLEQLVPNDNVSIIGIHGMGGVGKTRLLKTFFSQFPLRHKYLIVWIDMNGIHTVEEVRKAVAEKLGLPGHRNKSQEELAQCIGEFLEEKDTILILDNVWKVVDLIGVGIPTAPCHAKSKVIVATRLEDVCDSMGAAKVKVKCLEWEAAWSLFEEKVGQKLIESHSLIRWHAEGMVRKCGGLPLALMAVGSAMSKKKTPEKWEEAITTLENMPQKVPGMNDVLSRLKLSYDNIADDKLRTCLLYCSMFPDDCDIPKKAVTNYGIGEGFLADDCCDSCDSLDALTYASMIETSSNSDCVRMHPMIRVLALWIGGQKLLVRAGKELAEAPYVDVWIEVERISLMRNCIRTLSVRPESPFLLTLSLRENHLEKICNGFFHSMTYLRVLDLSETSIQDVPAEIGELKELLYLNLSGSPISSLPQELGNLIKLRFLGLSDTEFLKQIPEGLIANLTELQSLSMFASYNNWKVDSTGDGVDFEELNCLKLLKKLAISINTTLALQRLSWSPRLAGSTHDLEISQSKGLTSLSTATLGSEFQALSSLGLRRCGDLDKFVIDDGNYGQASPLQDLMAFKLPKGKLTLKSESLKLSKARVALKSEGLQSLRRLQIPNYKDITGLIQYKDESFKEKASTLPNLTALNLSELHKAKITLKSGSLQSLRHLRIVNCKSVRQLIHCEDESLKEEKEKKEIPEEINILPNLYHLSLSGLPELESLSCGNKTLAFPSLKVLGVQDCPKLRKLPLNPENLECIYGEVLWWKSLEWPENQGRILSKLQSIYVDKYPSSGEV